MKRRSFLAGLLLAPLAKYLPAPQGIPITYTEDLKVTEAQVDLGGSDQISIWLVSYEYEVWKCGKAPGKSATQFMYMAHEVHQIQTTRDRPVRINFLKRELNK